MRIISALGALWIILALIMPQVASAAKATESNETQTNFKIQYSLVINQGIMGSKKHLALNGVFYNAQNLMPEKSEEELKREKALAKFEAKRKSAALPKGKFTINASAYTAAADECGKSDGITASGLKVKERETIACPPHFPFGIKLNIEGMGTYICQDRGGAIKGNHVDIYMETKKEAFAFGRRNLLAEVVE
jgi:3D (Asp-Asp-Asp) domain-containing protein